MRLRPGFMLLVAMMLSAASITGVRAEETPKDVPVLGGVKVLGDKKELEIEGKVALDEGILDFLAVVVGGREYESVLALNCRPSALHAALLALGAKPGPTPAFLAWVAENHPEDVNKWGKVGSELEIEVEWKTDDGKTRCVPALDLLTNRRTKKSETDNSWIFTGSKFYKTPAGKQAYAADVDGAVISVTVEDAVIMIAYERGDPYQDAEDGFEVNGELVPKAGTPVLVHIRLKQAGQVEGGK